MKAMFFLSILALLLCANVLLALPPSPCPYARVIDCGLQSTTVYLQRIVRPGSESADIQLDVAIADKGDSSKLAYAVQSYLQSNGQGGILPLYPVIDGYWAIFDTDSSLIASSQQVV